MRTTGSKVVKKVATMSLAAGIALAASGCQVIVKPDPDDPSKDVIVDITPADPNNPSTDPNNPSTDPGKDKNPSDEPPVEPDYSMYSETLQTVLKSDYYNDIVQNGNRQEYLFDTGYNLAEAIPYNFLTQHNENIQYIKDGRTRADVQLYILNNDETNLYSRVELTYDNENNDYIKQYLIKYDLSDYQQEFEELKMLYQGKYAQANFLFQEIDKQIDPSNVELVSEFSIYENTYNGILNNFNSKDIIKNDFVKIDNYTITHIEQDKDDDETYYIDLIAMNSGAIMNMKGKLRWSAQASFPNGILKLGTPRETAILETSVPTPITCYYQLPTSKDFAKSVE